MKRVTFATQCVLVALAVSLFAAPVAGAPPTLRAGVGNKGVLAEDALAVTLNVHVRCAQGHETLEAFIYIVQDGAQSQFAGIPVTCDSKRHNLTVTVRAAPDQVFHRGPAQASGYILLLHSESGATVSENISQALRLRQGH